MKRQRDSNFELLRMIAICLVLLLHADFFAIGGPSASEVICCTWESFIRILFQSVAIMAVNIFVMISGWYGIRQSKMGITNLLFQCAFYLVIIYVMAILFRQATPNITGFKELIMATPSNWFVKAYIILYILAPVLNSFAQTASQKSFGYILIAFFSVQTLYGMCFPDATEYFVWGYSPLSFIGLYLLMRYIRTYNPKWSMYSTKFYALTLSSVIIGVAIICILLPMMGIGGETVYGYILLTYISPTTIVASAMTILLFSRIRINNQFINRLGASSFAVYLVYVNPNILGRYKEFFNELYSAVPYLAYWGIVVLIIPLLFLGIALFDASRIYIWKRVSK